VRHVPRDSAHGVAMQPPREQVAAVDADGVGGRVGGAMEDSATMSLAEVPFATLKAGVAAMAPAAEATTGNRSQTTKFPPLVGLGEQEESETSSSASECNQAQQKPSKTGKGGGLGGLKSGLILTKAAAAAVTKSAKKKAQQLAM
jgi:hypothetical protein